uniref:Protein spire homolog 2 n=1 Tax=Phallusia mammillata TaxID=59560 RepID=A0A6F9DSW6_9ASCI|nr:protein spire homolog 2 [Phallusia mammillata]
MNLQEILDCFNNPLKEEQVWALCYKCALRLQVDKNQEEQIKEDTDFQGLLSPTGVESILLDHHGNVEITGCYVQSESEVVLNLGLSMFSALDYGLHADEEQQISEPLEKLLSVMTCSEISDQENYDEGYNDDKLTGLCSLNIVVQVCRNHFTGSIEKCTEICQSTLKEAYLLKSFLCNLSSASKGLQKLSRKNMQASVFQRKNSLQEFGFTTWAHSWINVLNDMHCKQFTLRHVDLPPRPIESIELTPYEILMQDIRKKRYNLQKTNACHRSSKKSSFTVHDKILEFVRSKPSLTPVHERVLRPLPPRSKSVHEKLIEQIQDKSFALRPVNQNTGLRGSQSFTSTAAKGFEQRKVRHPNGIRFSDSIRRNQLLPSGLLSEKSWVYDDSVFISNETKPLRRTQSVAIRSHTKQPQSFRGQKFYDNIISGRESTKTQSMYQSTSNLQEMERNKGFTSFAEAWKVAPSDCLSLTVEEVMHIRQVLSRADLEKIQHSKEIYNGLKNEKICFNCKLRKFTIFVWSHVCQICKRKVCAKCLRKLQTPFQKYLKIPVYALSPASYKANSPTSQSSQPSFSMMYGNPFFRLSMPQKDTLKHTCTRHSNVNLFHGRKMDVCEECFQLVSAIYEANRGNPESKKSNYEAL